MPRTGRKRKYRTDPSEPEAEPTDGVETSASATPSPMKKKRKTPDERDAEWLEAHEYLDQTDEDILGMFLTTLSKPFIHFHSAKQCEGWNAACYDHFTFPPAIIEISGVKKYRFHCKQCVLLSPVLFLC